MDLVIACGGRVPQFVFIVCGCGEAVSMLCCGVSVYNGPTYLRHKPVLSLCGHAWLTAFDSTPSYEHCVSQWERYEIVP